MNRRSLWIGLPTTALLLVIVLAGCGSDTGETKTENESISLDGAASAEIDIQMGAGELEVAGGSSELVNAEFVYNVEDWKPEVTTTTTGSVRSVNIEQPSGTVDPRDIDDVVYEWTIKLNDDTPTSLNVELGAGKARLVLGGTTLTDLDVQMGAGESTIDLSGEWSESFQARIQGGTGKLTLVVPKGVGVRVEIDTGIGDVDVSGLTETEGIYENDAIDSSDVLITIEVQVGVGKVEIEVER